MSAAGERGIFSESLALNDDRGDAFLSEDLPLLQPVQRRIEDEFGLRPVVAAEIEFFLEGLGRHSFVDAMLHDIDIALSHAGLSATPVEKERGEEQYEVSLHPTSDPAKLASDLVLLRKVIEATAAEQGMHANFDAKPYADQPGNGLHIHLHLIGSMGTNLFYRDEDGEYSFLLRHAVAGQLALLRESMVLFAPRPQSYARYRAGEDAPVNVSWGANNRTTAIRLPGKPLDNKHFEHRVAGADAYPALALLAVLVGVHYGISAELKPQELTFGNAWDARYTLPALPASFDEAVECLRHSSVLPKYIDKAAMESLLRRILYPAAF